MRLRPTPLKIGLLAVTALLVIAALAVIVLKRAPEPAVAAKAPAREDAVVPASPPASGPEGVRLDLPEPTVEKPAPQPVALPAAETTWPAPKDEEIAAANAPRRYKLPPGAIMGLTIKAIRLYNVPVMGSDSRQALDSGVVHVPETSLPWSRTPQTNVYLAGHRIGYPGTGSRLLFYNLPRLSKGDEVILKDRRGRTYRYRVSEKFVVSPYDSWVMGQVRNRDMVTLQTCTPIPTFDKRLIVRADRI